MTKFILHGGYTSVQNEWNGGFFKEIVKDVPSNGKILIVYFARIESEYQKLFEQDKSQFERALAGKKVDLVVADKNSFAEQVKQSDAIYMRGGNTDMLLAELKKFPNFKDAIQGKTVAGSSAGAYVISKYYPPASKDGVHEGLGLAPVRVICHFQSEIHDYYPSYDPVSLMQNYSPELELVILRDCEYKIVEA